MKIISLAVLATGARAMCVNAPCWEISDCGTGCNFCCPSQQGEGYCSADPCPQLDTANAAAAPTWSAGPVSFTVSDQTGVLQASAAGASGAVHCGGINSLSFYTCGENPPASATDDLPVTFNISSQGVLQWIWNGTCSGISNIPFYTCDPDKGGAVAFNVSKYGVLQWQWAGHCNGINSIPFYTCS